MGWEFLHWDVKRGGNGVEKSICLLQEMLYENSTEKCRDLKF